MNDDIINHQRLGDIYTTKQRLLKAKLPVNNKEEGLLLNTQTLNNKKDDAITHYLFNPF